MQITLTLPDSLSLPIETFRQGQITDDGKFFKYADLADLCQSNLNTGLFKTFADQVSNAAVASLQTQLDAAKAGSLVALPPLKTPVPVSKS